MPCNEIAFDNRNKLWITVLAKCVFTLGVWTENLCSPLNDREWCTCSNANANSRKRNNKRTSLEQALFDIRLALCKARLQILLAKMRFSQMLRQPKPAVKWLHWFVTTNCNYRLRIFVLIQGDGLRVWTGFSAPKKPMQTLELRWNHQTWTLNEPEKRTYTLLITYSQATLVHKTQKSW